MSIATFALGSLDDFRQTRTTDIEVGYNVTQPLLRMLVDTREHIVLACLDIVSNTVILVDFILILYASPQRLRTLANPYCLMEFFVILTFYVLVIMDQTDLTIHFTHNFVVFKTMLFVLAFALCFRILRVIRLLSITKGWAALYLTLRATKIEVIYS